MGGRADGTAREQKSLEKVRSTPGSDVAPTRRYEESNNLCMSYEFIKHTSVKQRCVGGGGVAREAHHWRCCVVKVFLVWMSDLVRAHVATPFRKARNSTVG